MTAPAHDRAPARTPAWWMFWGPLASVGHAYLGFPALAVVRGLLLREERYDEAGTPASWRARRAVRRWPPSNSHATAAPPTRPGRRNGHEEGRNDR
jgi:hypothetical protein